MLAAIDWNENTIMMTLIFGLPIVATIGSIWLSMEKHKSETELKRSMIERGMSVEEIERVLAARSPKKNAGR